ncbi:hypothetical protein LCGC14_0637710 [marine sediment metagenome]|uniref:Uncharacterized protein n=1 Tax=marine sediment metagenome TaxID=412755 RepID=A0A0F9R058_9ZZZZ
MRIWIARQAHRGAFYLPMAGTKQNPSLMFFLPQAKGKPIAPDYLDELVRSQLEKQGIVGDSAVHQVVAEAEKGYEERRKIEEVQTEVKRLMRIKAAGGKLMQVGFRKWKQVFYPAVTRKG